MDDEHMTLFAYVEGPPPHQLRQRAVDGFHWTIATKFSMSTDCTIDENAALGEQLTLC